MRSILFFFLEYFNEMFIINGNSTLFVIINNNPTSHIITLSQSNNGSGVVVKFNS